MALSRVHTSAKAAYVAKLLLINKCLVTYPPMWSKVVPQPNHNPLYLM